MRKGVMSNSESGWLDESSTCPDGVELFIDLWSIMKKIATKLKVAMNALTRNEDIRLMVTREMRKEALCF
jgi:hypothetical protein